jgi:hypothetical protein
VAVARRVKWTAVLTPEVHMSCRPIALIALLLTACFDTAEPPDTSASSSALTWPVAGEETLVTSMNADARGDDGGCWDLPLGLPSNAVKWLQQHPCHARNNQRWKFEWRGAGFRIHSARDYDLCLDVPSSNYASGQDVQLFPCHSGNNQLWVISQGTTSSTIRPWQSPSLCLDVENGVRTGLAKIQLFGCHGGTNQAWKFHTYVDDDGMSCSSTVRFGAGGPTVSSGTSRSFRVTGHNFDVQCPLPRPRHEQLGCDDDEVDWLVVDRLGGSGGYTVRCFHTAPPPPPSDPPPPGSCPSGWVCCTGNPTACDECAPSNAHCE